jgi:hypothetical protein
LAPAGYYAKNLRGRFLLLTRLVAFAGEPRDRCVMPSGNAWTANALWRVSALYLLAGSRFDRLPAWSGVPFHRFPKAQDKAS